MVLQDHATSTIGDDTIDVEGGHILVGPAEIPHKIINSGEGILHMINLHPSPQVITRWLEH